MSELGPFQREDDLSEDRPQEARVEERARLDLRPGGAQLQPRRGGRRPGRTGLTSPCLTS